MSTSEVEVAKQLAPEVIASLPEAELFANLRSMEEHDTPLPTEVLSCLVSIAAAGLIGPAEHSDQALHDLLRCAKPWTVGEPSLFKYDDKKTWILSNAQGLTESEKLDWFIETFMSNFLVELLSAGEAKSARVFATCAALIARWDEDTSDAEIGDATAQAMDSCLKIARVLQAIISYDVSPLTPDTWEDIDYISKLRESASDTVDCSMAVAIADADWYNERLTKLLLFRVAVERSSEQFVADMNFWESLGTGFDPGRVADMRAGLSRLCVCGQELPESMTSQLAGKVCAKVKDIITGATEDEGIADQTSALDSLQLLISDCGLAFSLDGDFDEFAMKAWDKIKTTAFHRIEDQCMKILGQIAAMNPQVINDSVSIRDLAQFEESNAGFRIPSDNKDDLAAAMAKMLGAVAYQFEHSPGQEPTALLNMCLWLTQGLGEVDPLRQQAQLWSNMWKLAHQLKHFKDLGVNTTDRLANDSGAEAQWPILTKLRMDIGRVKSFRRPNPAEDILGILSEAAPILGEADAEVERAAESAMGAALDVVLAGADALRPMAGGGDNGASWLEGLAANASQADVHKHFALTLEAKDMVTLQQHVKCVREVELVLWAPLPMRTRFSPTFQY